MEWNDIEGKLGGAFVYDPGVGANTLRCSARGDRSSPHGWEMDDYPLAKIRRLG